MSFPYPTYIARGGRPGRWYIDNDQYGPNIPVLHYLLLGPDGAWPEPLQFLHGDQYDQPCPGENWPEKREQIRRIVALKGLVCMTYDYWEKPPDTQGYVQRRRLAYAGLWLCLRPRFEIVGEERHQRFVLASKLCDLVTPGGRQ